MYSQCDPASQHCFVIDGAGMSLRVGIIGGGIGGLTAAVALRQVGIEATVFEQAKQFGRVGNIINVTPNAARMLTHLGLAAKMEERSYQPRMRLSRVWDTGEVTSAVPMRGVALKRYGYPQYVTHRADLLAILHSAISPGQLKLDKKLVSISQDSAVHCRFADGSTFSADALVGADGIHSVTRQQLFGPAAPRFTETIAFRAIVPVSEMLSAYDLDVFTKWWGPDRYSQLVTCLVGEGQLSVFATLHQQDDQAESWSSEGTLEELAPAFSGYAKEARDILGSCRTIHKTAMFERDPMPAWSRGRATLLGDACHAMLPYMAQGGAMGMEDAVILAQCLRGVSSEAVEPALYRYETARKDRTARIQLGSHQNDWLRTAADADWVYGYDALTALS
jgi:salicylate hydroxylase